MNETVTQISAIVVAVIGLAVVAVLVSQRANTSGIITGGGTALSGVISAAIAPVLSGGGSTGTTVPSFQ